MNIYKANRSLPQGNTETRGCTNSAIVSKMGEIIFTEGLFRSQFDGSVASHAYDFVARKTKNLLACLFKFRPGPICPGDYRYRWEIGLLFQSERTLASIHPLDR